MARSAAPNIMRNGQHNSRADFLPSGPPRLVLNHEAAVGTYSLDKVVEELRECGIYPNLGNLLKRAVGTRANPSKIGSLIPFVSGN
jgi:hypothetical protein